jgi:hypothetical protein
MSDQLPAEENVAANVAAESISEMHRKLKAQRALTATLLRHVGTPSHCRGCGAEVIWAYHRDTMKNTPYDLDGVNHFATCPKATEFRQKKDQPRPPKEEHHP